MNYYLAQFSVDNNIFQGKLFQVHMQVQYSLPTSYSATGLTPGVVKTLLSTSHLLGTLTEDILVELYTTTNTWSALLSKESSNGR